jgi:uncharacterized protein (TIGR02246 family)
MTTDTQQIAQETIQQLERAWNSADGKAFGAPFAPDADFVDIRGDHHRTREAIAHGHQAILDSIYKDSKIRWELQQARALADGVILAHSLNTLSAPTGPLAGQHQARVSMVIVRTDEGWQITGFQNTMVAG